MHMKLALPFAAALCTVGATAFAQQRIESVGQPQVPTAMQSSLNAQTDIAGATRLILPSGWNALARKGIAGSKRSFVTTKAKEPWTEALERWLASEKMVARIDWKRQTVYLDPEVAGEKKTDAPSPAKQAPEETRFVDATPAGAAQKIPVIATTTSVVPLKSAELAESKAHVTQQWQVKVSDIRLETTIDRWAKQASYTLVWDADRHILITAEDTFNGTFEEALNRILNSPAVRGSDYPLEAVIYQNNPPVVRITGLGEQSNKE